MTSKAAAGLVFLTFPITLILTGVAAENDTWPQFRGPTMNAAVADNPDLPE